MLISVIGGDLRQITLAKLLENDGHTVRIFGFDKDIDIAGLTKGDSFENTDIIVLPLPVSHDGILINAPFSKTEIHMKSLIESLSSKTVIFGGKVPLSLINTCKSKEIKIFDYFEREELTVANAIPTAEGAIEIALSETPYTLHKSRCLIIGYGRIGKILADRLKAFGADVTVSARKCSDFAWIEANGYKTAHSNKLENKISEYQLIFNTVPSMILSKELLEKIPEDCLVIDLASKPGGVDFSLAGDLGVRVIWALSLPGKVAPITSGEIIKNAITNIINEMEGL